LFNGLKVKRYVIKTVIGNKKIASCSKIKDKTVEKQEKTVKNETK